MTQPVLLEDLKPFPIVYAPIGKTLVELMREDCIRIDNVVDRFPPDKVEPTIYTAMLAGELGIYRQLIEGNTFTERILASIQSQVAYRLYRKRFNPDWKIPRAKNGLKPSIDTELALWNAVYNLLVNLPAYYPRVEFPHPLQVLYFLSLENHLIMPYRFTNEKVGTATNAKTIIQRQNRALHTGNNPFPLGTYSHTVIELARHQIWDRGNKGFFKSEFWNPVVKARQQIPKIGKSGACIIDPIEGMRLRGGSYQPLKPSPSKGYKSKKVFIHLDSNLIHLNLAEILNK